MDDYVDFPQPDQELVLSLCAGGGGLDLGVRLALPSARTVGYVEIEVPAICCLVAHMEAMDLDPAPVWTDLKTFDWNRWRGCVDGLIGGYPCQPFSVAGAKRGTDDPRHLWPYIAEGVNIVRPDWCFFENVANHLNLGFADVARDLQAMGYRIAATLITAAEVGATHKRERLFILAHRCSAERDWWCEAGTGPERFQHATVGSETVAHPVISESGRDGEHRGTESARGTGAAVEYPKSQRCREGRSSSTIRGGWNATASTGRRTGHPDDSRSQGRVRPLAERPDELPAWPPGPEDDASWRQVLDIHPDLAPAIESDVRRMAHGMAARVDRLRLLGNGVVPEQAAYAFRSLARDLGW